ncbi:MAG: leucine--tRNA ligase [Candidatus Pacebacteria bacterium]|nr:leucine--tRNA ligase [Candidatus Paceibacterota bacterium]
MKNYDHNKIEKKWQKEWDSKKIYKTLSAKNAKGKKPFYVLDMFPYPSGAGLHVGHPRGYIGSDVYARKMRMEGFNVLHPMGYDAFGLPAEQYAIANKIHPRKAVEVNVKTFERQLSILGLSFDWSRKINTTDPEYYKWTQWIFQKIYESWYDNAKGCARPISELVKIFEKTGNEVVEAAHSYTKTFSASDWKNFSEKEQQAILMDYRLTYEGYSEVNWCPEMGTVLANDEIVDGPNGPVSERGGFPVEKKSMRQWFMRITAYADRLISGLEGLDWPEHIKEVQKNWIGKSEGLIFRAPVKDTGISIETFSAHFEACYADTFVVIAPDHPLLSKLIAGLPNEQEVLAKAKEIVKKREADGEKYKDVEGIFTGRYIEDPLGNGDLPIWVASFALKEYGTGIVKCSAHDERDFAFAKKYNIKLKTVLYPTDPTEKEKVKNLEVCFHDAEHGVLSEPAQFAGRNARSVRHDVAEYVIAHKFAKRKITYKLRDAVFARQRYWGEPIPLFTKDGMIHEVPEKKLPLKLPNVTSYEPTGTGESPLATVSVWKKGGFETNTMPGWAGSSWYFLRYIDPKNKKTFADKNELEYWFNKKKHGGVDVYVGGSEHSTGHLLYSRFWHQFLFDLKLVPTAEPFQLLRNQGMILAEDGRKMSKRWGNVINPDDIVKTYGADTLRLYEMFIGPFDSALPWQTNSIVGPRRFIERVCRLGEKIREQKIKNTDANAERSLHQTIKKVGEDIHGFNFNTAVSALMICLNEMEKANEVSVSDFKKFIQLLAPFAPYVAEELWHELGEKKSVHLAGWPEFEESKLVSDTVTVVVQVNGKVRAELQTSRTATQAEVLALANKEERVITHLAGATPKRVIYVPGRLINFVI